MGINKYGRRRTWLQGKIETRRETGEEEERTKFNNSSDDTQTKILMTTLPLEDADDDDDDDPSTTTTGCVVSSSSSSHHHHRYINLIVVITIIVLIKLKCLLMEGIPTQFDLKMLAEQLRDLFADERKDRNTSMSLNLVSLLAMMKQENCIKRHTDPIAY